MVENKYGRITAKIYFEERKEEADSQALFHAKSVSSKLQDLMKFEADQPHFEQIGQRLWLDDYEDLI